jgi:hypothetical protein
MRVSKKGANFALALEDGTVEMFDTESEARQRMGKLLAQTEIEEEDLYEDDGQPDEAQEWYDFDPDA